MYKLAYTERFKKAFNNLTTNEELMILVDIGHHDILKKF